MLRKNSFLEIQHLNIKKYCVTFEDMLLNPQTMSLLSVS